MRAAEHAHDDFHRFLACRGPDQPGRGTPVDHGGLDHAAGFFATNSSHVAL